jgi:phenylalanyl-tRNA synthetase beta chain
MKKYSKKWIQTFIKDELPNDEVILENISKKAFEVESIEKSADGDSLFEVKVLPNRVADAFNLQGMAREWAAVLDLKLFENPIPKYDLSNLEEKKNFLKVEISQSGVNLVNNFFAARIIVNQKTPTAAWVKDIIEKSGGRCINPIVDLTNLIIFSFGQPCHAFDAKKVAGNIQIRFAKEGEKLTVLGGKELTLRSSDIVVADDKFALDLAGVKGGVIAEVDKETEEIIFIVPNFNGYMVRSSSMYHNIRTDASKIFENNVSTFKTEEVFQQALATFEELFKDAKILYYFKVFDNPKENPILNFSVSDVKKIAGVEISKEVIKNILQRLRINIISEQEEVFSIQAPNDRLDINIKEDVLEEILRIYGFDNIPAIPLKVENNAFSHNKRFLIENKIRKILIEKGFTEIFNYSFVDKGEIKVLLPLAEDKSFLRTNLIDEAKKTYEKNYNYLSLMEKNEIQFFEIGNIFTLPHPNPLLNKEREHFEEKRVVICLEDNKKKSKNLEILENIVKELEEIFKLKINILNKNEKPALLEFSLDAILNTQVEINFGKLNKNLKDINYKTISIYPFISRDVAVWMPKPHLNLPKENMANSSSPNLGEDLEQFEIVKKEIEKLNLQNVEKIYKFDEFTKTLENGESRTSIAFRIIFQSYEKTLTAEEIEIEMQKVYDYLKENGFEIR